MLTKKGNLRQCLDTVKASGSAVYGKLDSTYLANNANKALISMFQKHSILKNE